MNRFTFTTLALVAALFFGNAQASFFLGVPVSTEVRGEDSVSYLGVQFGTYDLGGDFGLRGNLRVLPPLGEDPSFQLAGDLLYSSGEETVFYLGAGAGYAVLNESESLFVGGTIGFDVDAASLISVFLEAQPRYNLTAQSVALYLNTGLNFHFGE